MKQISTRRLVLGVITLAVAGAAAGTAYAQSNDGSRAIPKSWNYDIKDGKRVPKAERTTNPDGSWSEQIKQGSCSTTREGSAKGEIKATRTCG